MHQQPFATRINWLEQLAAQHSQAFADSTAQRQHYLQQHPTKIIALKCMDGRIHLPHATQTPLGIIQPYRNLGGIFDLGWPYLGDLLCEDIEQALQAGRPVLVLISYHYSAGDKWRGCAGFQCDKAAALAQALYIQEQLNQLFVGQPHCYAMVVGFETDTDALVLHGSTGQVLDLSLQQVGVIPQLPTLLQQLCPAMPQDIRRDLLPLLTGNIKHSTQQRLQRRELDIEHREWMLCLGRGFDFLHVPNIALIIGPFSPDLTQPVQKAAAIIRNNMQQGRIPADGCLLLTSVPYQTEGIDRRRAELKSRFFARFATEVIAAAEPKLHALVQCRSAVVHWPSRRVDWLPFCLN